MQYHGGYCLTQLCLWIGILADPIKNKNDCMSMVVLGICVSIAMKSAKILVQIDAQKAKVWSEELMQCEVAGECHPAQGAKIAGRFSFSSSRTSDRTGRTYVRAFYVQAAAPCSGVTPMMAMNIRWWLEY